MQSDNVVAYEPYHREDPPEGKDKINLGAFWYLWLNERKLLKSPPRGADGNPVIQYGTHFKGGHKIAQGRHMAMRDGYTPRFQKRFINPSGLLGKGSYGKVWLARFNESEEFAVKQVTTKHLPEELWKERDLLIFLKHKRIVNLVGAFHHGDLFYVFELCHCALNQKLLDLQDDHKSRFTIQIAEGIDWIHSKNVIHCDIKPDNFLITSSNNVVLADFGAALQLKNGQDMVRCSRIRGVLGYQDAESTEEFIYSKASDIFSLGCVFFGIWIGKHLLRYPSGFDKDSEVARKEYITAIKIGRIQNSKGLKYPFTDATRIPLRQRVESLCLRLGDVIVAMIEPRETRITAPDILEHRLIKYERKILESNNWKLDNGDNPLAKSVLIVDRTDGFEPGPKATFEENAAYAGIYYDEDEIAVQGEIDAALGKSLLSYDTHVIASFIKRHNLQDLLLTGLASKNPTDLAATRMRILKELVSGFLGRDEQFIENVSGTSFNDQETQTEPLHDDVRKTGITRVDSLLPPREQNETNVTLAQAIPKIVNETDNSQEVVYEETLEAAPEGTNSKAVIKGSTPAALPSSSTNNVQTTTSTGASFDDLSLRNENGIVAKIAAQSRDDDRNKLPETVEEGHPLIQLDTPEQILPPTQTNAPAQMSPPTQTETPAQTETTAQMPPPAQKIKSAENGAPQKMPPPEQIPPPAQMLPPVQMPPSRIFLVNQIPGVNRIYIRGPPNPIIQPTPQLGVWNVPPYLPPNQGGVVPDPSIAPWPMPLNSQNSSYVIRRALRPPAMRGLSVHPHSLTNRMLDNDGTLRFNAPNSQTVSKNPPAHQTPVRRSTGVSFIQQPLPNVPLPATSTPSDTPIPVVSTVTNPKALFENFKDGNSPGATTKKKRSGKSSSTMDSAKSISSAGMSSSGTSPNKGKKLKSKLEKKPEGGISMRDQRSSSKKKIDYDAQDDTKQNHLDNKQGHGSTKMAKGKPLTERDHHGSKSNRKRKQTEEKDNNQKKKRNKIAKKGFKTPEYIPSSESDDDDDEREIGEKAYLCPHCNMKFYEEQLCLHHIKHQCEERKRKRMLAKEAKVKSQK